MDQVVIAAACMGICVVLFLLSKLWIMLFYDIINSLRKLLGIDYNHNELRWLSMNERIEKELIE